MPDYLIEFFSSSWLVRELILSEPISLGLSGRVSSVLLKTWQEEVKIDGAQRGQIQSSGKCYFLNSEVEYTSD